MGDPNGQESAVESDRRGGSLHVVAILQGLFLTLVLIILISLVLAFLVYFSAWQTNLRLLNLLAHSSVIGGTIWAGSVLNAKHGCTD